VRDVNALRCIDSWILRRFLENTVQVGIRASLALENETKQKYVVVSGKKKQESETSSLRERPRILPAPYSISRTRPFEYDGGEGRWHSPRRIIAAYASRSGSSAVVLSREKKEGRKERSG